MKRSLRGSRQQPLPDMNNLNQTAQNIDPAVLNDVQSVVDKYGGTVYAIEAVLPDNRDRSRMFLVCKVVN